MAQFDASGCPLEFLSIVRKLEVDIQDKENLILKEKQLIEGAEKQIEEKTKATKLLQEKNAELERSIQHLNTLCLSQTKQIKSLKEGGELLKEQAKNKVELFEILKEKNDRIKGDCEAKYQEFHEKFVVRMNFYETLPLVPEYKHQLEKNIELHKQLEMKRNEENALKDKIKQQQANQEASNPQLSFTEWGVAIAKLMQRVMKIDSASNKNSLLSLQEKVKELEGKKKDIQKKQSKIRNSTDEKYLPNEENMRELQKNALSYQANPTQSPSTFLPKLPSLPTAFKPSIPDFRSFFNDRHVVRNQHVPGSSGSSLMSSSVPNLPSALFNSKSDQQTASGNVQRSLQPNIKSNHFPSGKNLPTDNIPSIDPGETKLQRSLSLTALLPQVKPMKKIDAPLKSSFKSVRSLADWLKPPSKKPDQIFGDHKLAQIVESRTDVEESKKNSEERANKSKNEKVSRPHSVPQSHAARMTEVPLLRQVQEKILHEKIAKDQETQELTICENDPPTVMEVEQHHQDETKNMLKMFDGPVYDVPMAEDGENEEIRTRRSQESKSLSDVPHYSVEEHQRMMAELQKSPEDGFRFQSNVVPTDGGENSYMISPTRSDTSPEQNSPENIGCRISSANDFQFAVPTQPPPSRNKQPWASSLDSFSFNIGHNESKSQKEGDSSPSPFGSFRFNGDGDASPESNPGFSFDIGQSKSTSSEASSFSFMFGGSRDGAESPPDTSSSMFTFGSGTPKSPDEDQTSFFGSSVDDRDESTTSSFASIFGCKK